MIYVPRSPASAEVLQALSKPLRGGLTELQVARNYYAAVPRPARAYTFKRYKEFEVCVELDSMFRGKCAYCEAPYRAVDARNIEHFRPKGGVTEHPPHPGYWWLAADWTNLLPCCPPCNQRRRHIFYRLGMTAVDFERELQRRPAASTGKGNFFPLSASNWVDQEGVDVAVEDPLLINPCLRNPELHMRWVFDRDRSVPIWEADPVFPVLMPRVMPDGSVDRYADASIKVYGLNRSGLIRERVERLRELQRASIPAVDAFIDLANLADQQGKEVEEANSKLAKYKRLLYAFAAPETRFSSMASAYLLEFEQGLPALGS